MATFLEFLLKNPTVPVVVVGTAIAYFSLRSQQHLTRAKHTLDFDREFKEKHKTTLIRASKLLKKMSWAELASLGHSGSMSVEENDPFTTIAEALNMWEGVAIGLESNVYSEEQLFKANGTTVVLLYKYSIPFIAARQADNPRAYCCFVRLAIRWMSRRSLPLQKEKELTEKQRQADLLKLEEREALRRLIRAEVIAEIRAAPATGATDP